MPTAAGPAELARSVLQCVHARGPASQLSYGKPDGIVSRRADRIDLRDGLRHDPDRSKAARELLAFYQEAGVDALLGETPVDRFADASARASAPSAPSPAAELERANAGPDRAAARRRHINRARCLPATSMPGDG